MYVNQIYLTDSSRHELPDHLIMTTNTVRAATGNGQYRLFEMEALREYIKSKLGNEVIWALDCLRPYSYKADLGRFSLLFAEGGWYFDITVKANQMLVIDDAIDHVCFKDSINPGNAPSDVSTSVIFAKAGSKVYEHAINQITHNCKNKWYGVNALDPTGPGVLGRAFAATERTRATLIGNLLPLTPYHYKKNYAFVLPDGSIFAWGKSTWGQSDKSLSGLGAKGTNNYEEMYITRNVYSQ